MNNRPSQSSRLLQLLHHYTRMFREEPKVRSYLGASLIDDIGVAVSAWAATLIMTNLFVTQRERAKLMLPSLACFLLGTIVSGPLADWASRSSLARLARWRWQVVLWARLVETLLLGLLALELLTGPPTLLRLLPYVMVSAFMKTGLRSTRIAFSVDLLHREELQVDDRGRLLYDERGEPLRYKTHLLTSTSLVGALSTVAALAGLLLGGRILSTVSGRYGILFLFDVLTNLGFVAVVLFGCHPGRAPSLACLRDLWTRRGTDTGDDADASTDRAAPAPQPTGPARTFPLLAGFRHFNTSLREGLRFLFQPAQRPLLTLLLGSWLVEVVTESYDGKMILKHVLHGGDDAVRYGQIVWSVVAIVVVTVMPVLARRIGSIGKVFLATMLLDGIAIAVAGRYAAGGTAAAIVPFTATIAIDHALTMTSTTLTALVTYSASSAAIRGRVTGIFAFFVIIGDMLVEGLATGVSERIGIPQMVFRVGLLQIGLVVLIGLLGGRRLWRFGLNTNESAASAPPPAPLHAESLVATSSAA
ncbi:MAG TPA: hypothetical protein VH877_31970 [Polyangia bacterium]|nr:hypothetical protein [Polyangia bacterium]